TPPSTLFPYTTLFRSGRHGVSRRGGEIQIVAQATGGRLRGARRDAHQRLTEGQARDHRIARLRRRIAVEARPTDRDPTREIGEEIGRAHVCTPVTSGH